MIRPRAQSLTRVVSHKDDARIPGCECPGADEPQMRRHLQRTEQVQFTLQMLTEYYLQRLV